MELPATGLAPSLIPSRSSWFWQSFLFPSALPPRAAVLQSFLKVATLNTQEKPCTCDWLPRGSPGGGDVTAGWAE